MSLKELQEELREGCAVESSLQTITRTLQREGYTMKMVRLLSSFLINNSTLSFFRSLGLLSSEMSKTGKRIRLLSTHTSGQNNSSSLTRAISTG